jgi:hypothetical protein
MLVTRQHPGDLVEIDAVLVLENAARPDAGGDGVAAIDADLLAFEILGAANAELCVDDDGTRKIGSAVNGLPCSLAQI